MYVLDSSFVIDRKILGTSKHLLSENKTYKWTADIAQNVWHLTGHIKNDSDRCLDTLFQLNGIEIDIKPPQRFIKAMDSLMSGSTAWPPPWQKVMPKVAHRTFAETLLHKVTEGLERSSKDYYDRVWVPGNNLLRSLQQARVDNQRWESLIAANKGNVAAIRSFEPDANGFASQVVYDRFGTVTGRPLVASGPQILTLKKEHRNLLTSRWGEDGQLIIVDFAALEARVLLYEAGKRCDNPDMYSEINNDLFNGSANRNDVKGAVISELYGQSKRMLGERLGIKGKHLNFFVSKIKGYFRTETLMKRVKQQFVENGYLLNRYGRRVVVDNPVDHVFVNYYAQSSGADVAMLGFNEMLQQLSGYRVAPIFLIYDAIILDCHKSAVDAVNAVKTVNVDGYVQRFFLRAEPVGCTHVSEEVHFQNEERINA